MTPTNTSPSTPTQGRRQALQATASKRQQDRQVGHSASGYTKDRSVLERNCKARAIGSRGVHPAPAHHLLFGRSLAAGIRVTPGAFAAPCDTSRSQKTRPVRASGPAHHRLSATPLIEIDHVSFGYDERRLILNDISLRFERGKVTSILGGSGCGKTTLLRLIGGVHAATPGRVVFDGKVLDVRDKAQMHGLRRRLGMLFQFGALFTDLTVFENVAFPLREHTDLPEAMIRDIVLMKLNAVGLRGAAGLRISEVSGGMARRIALARAIALDPELIMYDEPFAGLDLISMGVAAKLIRTLNDTTGATSLVVSHDVPRVHGDLRLGGADGDRRPRGGAGHAQGADGFRRPRGAPVRARRARRAGQVPLPGARAGRGLRGGAQP